MTKQQKGLKVSEMSTSEYMRRQNRIMKKYGDVLLIPPEQIIEVPVTQQMLKGMKWYINAMERENNDYHPIVAQNSPYCYIYFFGEAENNVRCEGCPIANAGNHCMSLRSSYQFCTFVTSAKDFDINNFRQEFVELAKEFIQSYKEVSSDS